MTEIGVFIPDRNRKGLNDYTGAYLLYAKRFKSNYSVWYSIYEYDRLTKEAKLFNFILNELKNERDKGFNTKLTPKITNIAKYLDKINRERMDIHVNGVRCNIHEIDITNPSKQRFQCLKYKVQKHRYKTFAIMCHGTNTWTQLGLTQKNAAELVDCIPEGPIKIILYACNSMYIASFLAGAARKKGFEFDIYGHATTGHTTINPHVRHFQTLDRAGQEIICSELPEWETWVELMKTDFCLKFTLYTRDELKNIVKKYKKIIEGGRQ